MIKTLSSARIRHLPEQQIACRLFNGRHNVSPDFSSQQLCVLSSVVEHYLHTVGVAGSKPAARTIFY